MAKKDQGMLRFGDFRLMRDAPLGKGSYGQVCKATLDELLCAAKVIHPTLVDPNHPRNRENYLQECRFLADIRHPNIVQYLGVEYDEVSNSPVLLMELMECSLTHFLEQSEVPLAYHVQVNISHDIALAVAFLHLNGVVHRDLSSNNVLLIGDGSRAKVTDFGMSKLIDKKTYLTQCPGTSAYMAPEALLDPPAYTEKLDCFQEGVLMIQIITRKFPEPGPATNKVRSIKHLKVVLEVVPEVKRRSNHLSLVPQTHPMLPLAMNCLKDEESERPPAQQICQRLSALKKNPQFIQSLEKKVGDIEKREQLIKQLRQENEESKREIRKKERDIESFQVQQQQKEKEVREKEEQVRRNERDIESLHGQLQQKEREVREKEREVRKKETDIDSLQLQKQQKEGEVREKEGDIRNKEREIGSLQSKLQRKEREVQEKREEVRKKERVQSQQQKSIAKADREHMQMAELMKKQQVEHNKALQRMELYRQERDQAKAQLAELQLEVQTYQEEVVESQETIAGLQKALDESSSYGDQEQAHMWQQEIDALSHKVEEYEKRMKQYCEERNTAQIMNYTLQQQVATLQRTLDELQRSQAYSSKSPGQFDSVTGSASMGGGFKFEGVSSSPQDDQIDFFTPDRYPENLPSLSGETKYSESRIQVGEFKQEVQKHEEVVDRQETSNLQIVPTNPESSVTSSVGGFVSPLCSVSVESANPLHLQFPTSCPGYDKDPDERGVPSAVAAPTNVVDNLCQVQFTWQPLTVKMKHPKITLLTSFDAGCIDLTLDPEGGQYYSPQLSILRGAYEGQLVVGDSFIYPVKEFTVDNDGGIIALEFKSKSHGGKMEEEGEGGALVAHEGRTFEKGRRGKTGTFSEGEGLLFTGDFDDCDPSNFNL